ncbi:MAG: Glutathione S-transferase (EC [uncultured Paraburkholderia sp.]|nr:MAG: Glutathione S-transferase (EC [uncultured Paraburkholderia sp.]
MGGPHRDEPRRRAGCAHCPDVFSSAIPHRATSSHDRSSAFPITKKWPAEHPERLQLYSLPTPNGVCRSCSKKSACLTSRIWCVSTPTTR